MSYDEDEYDRFTDVIMTRCGIIQDLRKINNHYDDIIDSISAGALEGAEGAFLDELQSRVLSMSRKRMLIIKKIYDEAERGYL